MNWDDVKQLPVKIYQTVRGPVITHCDRVHGVNRWWAPAFTGKTENHLMNFAPLLYCEAYMDVLDGSAAILGHHAPPGVVEQAYREIYVPAFIQGVEKMSEIIVRDPRYPEPPPKTQVRICAACGHIDHAMVDSCTVLHCTCTSKR